MLKYKISLGNIEKRYGVTLNELVAAGLISKKRAEKYSEGETKALSIWFVNEVCEYTGCKPEELFEVTD